VRRSEGRWQRHKDLKAKLKKTALLLEKEYGVPQREKRADPLDILIQTILSQNTNDRNRDRAYEGLKSRFPRWEDVLKAKREAVISAIRPGGLAGQKARRIREILRWIKRLCRNSVHGSRASPRTDYDMLKINHLAVRPERVEGRMANYDTVSKKREKRLSLSFLTGMGSEEIKELIGRLKGVGPKTVHCLLLFGLGRDAFPVDTHILRIGKRIGFIPERMNAVKAHLWMVPLIPKEKSLSLHLNLIRFGRSICRAKRPRCEACFLAKECLYNSQ